MTTAETDDLDDAAPPCTAAGCDQPARPGFELCADHRMDWLLRRFSRLRRLRRFVWGG